MADWRPEVNVCNATCGRTLKLSPSLSLSLSLSRSLGLVSLKLTSFPKLLQYNSRRFNEFGLSYSFSSCEAFLGPHVCSTFPMPFSPVNHHPLKHRRTYSELNDTGLFLHAENMFSSETRKVNAKANRC